MTVANRKSAGVGYQYLTKLPHETDRGKKVKVFRYKPDVALGVPGG
jgi:hypothetical protein